MPVWHELAEPYLSSGQIQVLGILQEQHPDRALLFAQWKRLPWPLLVDSLNLLGVRGAPMTLFLDEAGIIREVNPASGALESFLEEPEAPHLNAGPPPTVQALLAASGSPNDRASLDFLFGGPEGVQRAIGIWEPASESGEGRIHFRLGVAYRQRHEGPTRRKGDFARAVRHWTQALESDPNQYIWRRRIQQYGPRMDKPYSFYDWVAQARKEIGARGEIPLPLRVEPEGAELASPARSFQAQEDQEDPDPRGLVHRDMEGLARVEATVVPVQVEPGGTARIHLRFMPEGRASWNNEAEDMRVWIGAQSGWMPDRQLHTLRVPPQATSRETRRVELEAKAPEKPGQAPLRGHALYHVCRQDDGVCLYRRLDFAIPVEFKNIQMP